jgi:Flp pilus assembly protein TadB
VRVFGRNKTVAPAQETTTSGSHAYEPQRAQGKGAPTPKRSVQEAARRRPLVPTDRKAAREQSRSTVRDERLRMRQALDTDDERFLPLRDKGPTRRYIRQFVDARVNVGEFLMIAALVFVILSFFQSAVVQSSVLLAFWVLIVVVLVDCLLLRRKLKRKLTEKFGGPNQGDLFYGITRALQFRRLRLPKPQVARGQYPS